MTYNKLKLDAALEAAKGGGVVPDVIDSFKNVAIVSASFNSKAVHNGNELSIAETQDLPKVEVDVPDISDDATYVLVVTDPDAPRRGENKWSEYLHFLATDIKLDPKLANQPQEIKFDSATILHSYVGPAPPPDTGLHRYVFVLLEGTTSVAPKDRIKWGYEEPGSGLRKWLEGQSLTPLGINYFEAQNISK